MRNEREANAILSEAAPFRSESLGSDYEPDERPVMVQPSGRVALVLVVLIVALLAALVFGT